MCVCNVYFPPVECLNLLLSLGVSADAPDENEFTSLHIAAANGQHG